MIIGPPAMPKPHYGSDKMFKLPGRHLGQFEWERGTTPWILTVLTSLDLLPGPLLCKFIVPVDKFTCQATNIFTQTPKLRASDRHPGTLAKRMGVRRFLNANTLGTSNDKRARNSEIHGSHLTGPVRVQISIQEMGKRKLAGSVRRYVATGLSRVTKGIAGAFHSHEERKTRADETSNQMPSDINGSLPASTVEALPTTKVPALDTVDRYAADGPIVGVVDPVGKSPRVKLSCSSDVRNVIDGLLRGYARFISSFTGLEDIAFFTNRGAPFVESNSSLSVIIASVPQNGGQIKLNTIEVDAGYHDQDEVQFHAELGSAIEPENGENRPLFNQRTVFSLLVEAVLDQNAIHISFTYPNHLIPDPARDQVLETLLQHIVESSPLLALESPNPAPSVLNFPPSMIPPTYPSAVDDSILDPHLLHAAFEGWAHKKPHAVALDFVHSLQSDTSPADHSILTYAAFDTAASNLAVHIRSLLSTNTQSHEYGRIIAVHMSTSVELYISYLGVLKAGYAFCPIPQDAPTQRIREILHDIASPIILGNSPESPREIMAIDDHPEDPTPIWVNVTEASNWKELQGEHAALDILSRAPLEHGSINQEQTAYLLFTSGSTGKPKGVQVSHLASACSIASHATAIPLPGKSTGDFRWFQFASPSFDPSLMEIFVTLSSGATLCSANRTLMLSNLEETINETKATIMMATPSLASIIRPDRLETLKALWSMGEQLNRTVIGNFAQSSKSNDASVSRTLVNAYGPTEGAINCTFVAPFKNYMRGSIIGKPLPTCSMFVLCPHSRIPKSVPAGTVGELAIGGPQVSKGYLNQPEETSKSFIHSSDIGYIYRTGDKARIVWDDNGDQVIEYLGRISMGQVKVNGRRVELGEIESVIATVPGIAEVVAVVSPRDDKLEGNEQIVVCLVANDMSDKKRIVDHARKNAAQHLTPSMYPSTYTFLDSLPRSSSGKVDRKAMLALLQTKQDDVIAPKGYANGTNEEWQNENGECDSIQQLVVRLISETTEEDVSNIKPGSDLYSLGMDSLSAMRFLQKLKDSEIKGLSTSDILQSRTPQALVSLIRGRSTNLDAIPSESQDGVTSKANLQSRLTSFSDRNHALCAEKLGIPADSIAQVLPTTATQSGMLTSFLRSTTHKSYTKRTYIYHSVLTLKPHANLSNLKKAWGSVIAGNDCFRTVFCMVDDATSPFAQCILTPENDFEIHWRTYTSPNADTPEEDFINRALRDAEDSINLSRLCYKLSLIETSRHSLLSLSMFHGIFDGSSLQLLLEDVALAYTGAPLVQRTSIVHIVKHHFQTDREPAFQFWQEQLRDYSPAFFPSITPHQTPSTKCTGTVEVPSFLTHDLLRKQSRNLGSTPLSVLQAAWGAVLLNYTGTPDQDVVMGSVVSGRLDAESRTCIGPTFTITPLRISVPRIKKTGAVLTNSSVIRHLTFLNAQALSHLQHQLGTLTSPDGQLPFDTVLAYQDFGSLSTAGKPWISIRHPPMANDFSVMIEVVPELDGSMTLRASFDIKLDSTAAEVLLRQFDCIIRYIFDKPEANFEESFMQTSSNLKSAWNPNPLVAPEVEQGALLQSQFEDHAVSHPNDLALVFKQDLDNVDDPGNITWSYGELNAMADDLAEHLLQLCGQLADASVPICIEKSPALYVAILGILKAGAAWCPIDTLSPVQRRHDLIARTSAGVLLVSGTDGAQPEGAVPAGIKIVDVAQFTRNISLDKQRQSTRHRATPSNVAYLIWTSGTTGAPKGVPITHSAAVSSMRSLQNDIPGNTDGSPVRCLQFSQCTFDVSIQDIFYTWGIGGVLISATREIMLDSFSQLANITNATHAHLTPAFAAGVPREQCKTLNVVTMIGEKLTQPVADDWGTNMRAFNTYGPAEVTVVSTIREFGNEHKSIKSANIGWPMKSVSVFVMKNHRIVMKNAIGELALGGPQLSPGYLNQKDVTDAKYIWNEETQQKLYYTGDLVRMLADGSLEYITRVDDLVKLGGIRIELSEISFALRGCHPLVDTIETLILSRPDRPTDVVVTFLCAPRAPNFGSDGQLLLLADAAVEIAQAANQHARNSLPEYMIPTVYLVLKSIPKTPSAKVDRRALKAAYASVDLDDWESKVNPRDPASDPEDELDFAMSARIVDILAALVDIDASSITKSNRLRSLGVDSLRATRLTYRLKEAGYSLSVMGVLNCITVHDLLRLATSSDGSGASTPRRFDVDAFDASWHGTVAAKITDEFKTVRATAVQESLLTETLGTYNMYWSNHFFKLDRSVDVPRLRQAWFAVCQKTEALRTGFIPVAETRNQRASETSNFSILQVIYKLPSLDWEYHKCTEQNWTEVCDERIEGIMARHQKNYFRHPPWAVTILDKGNERVMVFSIHHSVHDEPSLRFIADDVRAAYTYKPPLRSQLSDALSIVLANESKYSDALEFWQSELKQYGELDVPVWPDLTGKRLPPGVTAEYRLISEECPVTQSATKLQSVSASMGLRSIAAVIRTAWAYVSLSYLGLPASVFAETLSDRIFDPAMESTVGPFISVLPVPFNPKGSAREVLIEQHRLATQSWKHRHIHARDIRKALNRPRGEPLYPAVFNFHAPDQSPDNRALPNIWREMEDQIGLHVEHPMAMNVFQKPDNTLALEASSDSRLFSGEQLRLFVRQVDSLITSMLAFPDEPLANLINRMPSELRSLSNRSVSQGVANSIHQAPTYWLEKNAEIHPDWTAVEVASSITADGIVKESLTYAALNAEANRVAAYLASFGYKNRIIGVSCGRTIASYPIIIGIFKSGNTYLPIDENLPADRKAFLLEDSNSPLVFTETHLSESFSGVPDSCRVECVDNSELQSKFSEMVTQNKDYKSHPDDNSYLLFTSGSTGKPKGVMITRANLSSFIESISEFACQIAPDTFMLGGTGRYLAQANRAFDPHLLEMFFPWRHGLATVTAPRPMILDDIGITLSKWDITHASFVPSLVDQSNITPEQCPKLRFMTVGGEKITQKVLDTWASAPNVAIVNAYGPTEVTIGCTFAHINKFTNLRNIGPPLTACVGHVLIPGTLNYALRGQTGELCFSGDLVGKGYLNRPDATGFITLPDGTKMYRTGDMGRLMADDSVEYLGRGDDQTKIRGQRLELGEVSEVLRVCSPISIDVVTTVAKHPGLAKSQLLSFVSRSPRGKVKDDNITFLYSDFASLGRELQDICRKKLPAYMVPELILPVTTIPIAPMSGKANMKELHRLFSELPLQTVLQGNSHVNSDGLSSQRQLNADEESVVNEICHVVSADPKSFGPLTNIFEVGLDSLNAIGLSIRLRNVGYAATVALVMSNPVIEQLARLPKSPLSGSHPRLSKVHTMFKEVESLYRKSPSPEIPLSKVAAVRPCLPLQEGLVARSLNSDGDQLYVNHVTLQLDCTVGGKKLESAWQRITSNNDILRTVFVSLENDIVQVILSGASYDLQWTNAEYASLEDAITQRKSQQGAISQSIITNISCLPPVTFHLATSATDKRPLALFIAIHHSLYDGESFSMILDDVAAYYEETKVSDRGSPSTFLEHLYLQDSEKTKQHWVQYMSGCNPTLIRPAGRIVRKTASVRRSLRANLSDLERRSANLQTTVPNLMQAIFALLFADHMGSSSVTYGLVLSGRTVSAPGAESVLLPCITTIPARLSTKDLNTVTDVIEDVQRATVRSLEFQHTPLRKIQQWLKSETPLFDCLFSFIRSGASPKHNLWKELDSAMPSEYPLALEVRADSEANTIELDCIFSPHFGTQQDAVGLLEKLEAVLSDVVSGETVPLENFNLAQSKMPGSQLSPMQWDDSQWFFKEMKIRDLTASFCGLDSANVSKGASFLSLGIDSVTAIQFARKLRDEGLKVSSSDIMRFPCVGALAKHVDEASSMPQTNGVTPSEKGRISVNKYGATIPLLGEGDCISSMFECTSLQSGMITQTISSGGKVYVNPHAIRLDNSVDTSKLKAALQEVIQRNDILRTSFHLIEELGELGEGWIGAVHSKIPLEWAEIDMLSDTSVIAKVISLSSFDGSKSFEVPPLRAVLVNQPEGKILVLVMHHALYDGASLPFVFEDLARAYSGQSPVERPQFPDMVPYILEGQEESCDFWTTKLRGYESAEVPPLEAASKRMLATEYRLDLNLAEITKACKDMEVTIQSVSLLSYAKVYARLLGKRDVVFGQVLAGRTLRHPEADLTLGPLFNTVAQRVTFESNFLSNKALAQRVQSQAADAQNHQHAPLRVIQNKLRQAGQLQSTQLFESLFVFQKSAALSETVLYSQDIWSPYDAEDYVVDAEYKLNLEVDHTHDGIVLTATCNAQYISQDMLDKFIRDFEAVFGDIIEHPTRCATTQPEGLGELPLQILSKKSHVSISEVSEAPAHEDLIRSVLAEVTGIPLEEIKPDTSIFNLGLDSLSAIRIASLCRGRGLKAGVGDILQGNTVRGISQRVRSVTTPDSPSQGSLLEDSIKAQVLEKLQLKGNEVETVLPTLPGQFYHLASWLKSERKLLEPVWAFFSTKRIDSARLEDAWLRLRKRHPVLRTVFSAVTPSEAVQVVLKGMDNARTFKIVESPGSLTGLAKAQAYLEALDPSTLFSPPVRLRLLRAADKDGILIIINHALYDAWTMPMLVSELGKIYNERAIDTNPDFPAFVSSSIHSLSELNEKDYWKSALKASEPTFIKGAKATPSNNTQVFVDAWEKIKDLSQLETTCRSVSLSLQTIVLLAVSRRIATITGVTSPTVGLYQSGRSASFSDIEKLSGPCLNVNPFVVPNALPSDEDEQQRVLEQARDIQASLAKRASYEQSSLRDILQWTNPKQAGAPTFNTWINLLWIQDAMASHSDEERVSSQEGELFQPLRIGVPTDFIPREPLPASSTAIDGLDTSFLPNGNIFIDIGPDPITNTIGFGVRVEGGALDEDEVRVLIDGIANEIKHVVSLLG
ncbi:peptide synthetase [Aspergillus ustus]|uniref:Nonribosomal peptide synthetase sidC n=1 Tax=Aspergillus ustus TaxID=40382 RepID=A0A0C1C3C6_ASPUT|nr:peptide synthetase [Aspergillus ustus]